MVRARRVGPILVLMMLLMGPACGAEEQPRLTPTRDVDIRYDVTRPQKPKVRERVRWLAAEGLERVDASGRSTSIFERAAHNFDRVNDTRFDHIGVLIRQHVVADVLVLLLGGSTADGINDH